MSILPKIETTNVVSLLDHRNPALTPSTNNMAHYLFTALSANSIDFSCPKVRSSYRVIIAIIQGMLDKKSGTVTERSVLVESLCFAFDPQDFTISNDTEEFFGNLFSYVDQYQQDG